MTSYPFVSVGQALTFWMLSRPANYQRMHLWDAIPGSTPRKINWTADLSALDAWHKITIILRDVLRSHDAKSVLAFSLYWRITESPRKSKEEIAYEMGLGVRRVQQMIKNITDDIEERLIRRQLMPSSIFDA